MEDFNSKYSGEQVEALLDQVASGNAGGGGSITAETDPVFSASPAATITEEKKAEWDNKVDKVSGKQLSTEDFTSTLKTKLEGLSNYDDTELSTALSTLRSDFDKLVSGDTTTAIKTFNEIIAFLDGIQDTQDLSSIIASIEQQIAAKQDKITDLDTIRDGASKGATAVQPEDVLGIVTEEGFVTAEDLAGVASSGSYNDLSDKPTIPSAINIAGTNYTPSGSGIIDLNQAGLYRKPSDGIPKNDLSSEIQTALTNADAYKGTVTGVKINGTTKSPSNGVIDLGDIPTSIPSEVYIADFTMESLKTGMNNVSQVNCDMPALITAMNANKVILVREGEDSAYKGVYVLNGFAEDLLYFSIVDSSGSILWCEGTPHIDAYIDGRTLHLESWYDKQDTLVSGENIKTINGESILGSGNISIEGGTGEKGDKGDKGDTGATGVGVQSVKQTTISNTDGGSNVVTVTLTNGTTSTFTVKNGSKGSNGSNGTNGADGEDGATFTPSVDSEGNLSWTNNKGLTNPPTVNIKGPKGDAGEGGGSTGVEGGIQWTMRFAGDYIDDNGVISLDPFVVYYGGYFSGDGTILFNGDNDYNEWRIIFYIGAGNSLTINIDNWVNGIIPDISAGGLYELSVVDNEGGLYGVMAHFHVS